MLFGVRDESLMLAFQRGDHRAFEVLMKRHRATVFNFLLRYVGERSRAEDLTQETWMRVIRHAPGYQPSAKFTTWLLTMARNLAVDLARRERFRAGAAEVDCPSDAIGPEGDAANRELRSALRRALSDLPHDQREVFLLREWGGVTFKEIAGIVGVNENTAKSRMRYALEALRASLGEAGFGREA